MRRSGNTLYRAWLVVLLCLDLLRGSLGVAGGRELPGSSPLGAASAPGPGLEKTSPEESTPTEVPGGKPGAVIPFAYDPLTSPYIVIQAKINNQESLPFVVDTGSSAPVMVTVWAAKALHLRPDGRIALVSPGNVKSILAQVQEVECVGISQEQSLQVSGKIDAAIVEDSALSLAERCAGRKIAGILGMPLFSRTAVQLDFLASTIHLSAGAPAPPAGASVLPLIQREGLYYTPISPGPGLSADLLVDTGSYTTRIPAEMGSQLQSARRVKDIYSELGSVHFTDSCLLSSLTLGSFKEPECEVLTCPSSDGAVLGLGILSRFRITFDFPGGHLILERTADYWQRIHLDGKRSIGLVRRGSLYYVGSIAPGSTPARAGIQAGDEVVSVDNWEAAPLPAETVSRLLEGFANTQARLTLQRHGSQPVKVAFQRESKFEDCSDPTFGLLLQRDVDGRLVVTEDLSHSWKDWQELNAGDEVTELNGQPAASMPWVQVADQLRKPRISLKIVHKQARDTRVLSF